jgi:hypothetical protein
MILLESIHVVDCSQETDLRCEGHKTGQRELVRHMGQTLASNTLGDMQHMIHREQLCLQLRQVARKSRD